MKKFLIGLVAIVAFLFVSIVAFQIFRKDYTVPKDEVISKASLPESHFVEWKGMDIHYIEKGEGEDVLLVHGLGGSVFDFEDLFYKMSEDYHVVAVDLPGFSLSDAPDMTQFEEGNYLYMYRDFTSFVFEHFEFDSLHLIGNSMGGWLSWEAAVDHPEKLQTLTLLAPAGYEMDLIAEKTTSWLKSPVAKFLLAKGLPESITEINLGFCYANDDLIEPEEVVRRNMVSNKEGNLEWMKELGLASDFADTNRIHQITTPTLIVWGDADEIIPYEHAAMFHKAIPNSTLLTYENIGHTPQMECMEKLWGDVVGFIKN